MANSDFERLLVKGRRGVTKTSTAQGLEVVPQPRAAIGELGRFEPGLADQTIYRKDLRPVVYVSAELNWRTPAEIIAEVYADADKEVGSVCGTTSRLTACSLLAGRINIALPHG